LRRFEPQLPGPETSLFSNARPWSNRHVRRLFIVGAGFSKALYEEMPLANELVAALKSKGFGKAIVTGALETSLAFLAEPHPFDRGAEPYERQALLTKALQAIAEVIAEKSEHGKARLPSWFDDLRLAWVRTGARVVSFNYDLLIESKNPNFNEAVDLHKPHGSLNLCWRSNSQSSIERCDGSLTTIKSNFEKGKVPFVVPPTTSKSSYYHIDALALPWHVFRESLETAEEIVLLGFSMAEADATVTGLMSYARGKKIVVVDRDDGSISDIKERLRRAELEMNLGIAGVKSYVEDFLIPEIICRSFDPTLAGLHVRDLTDSSDTTNLDTTAARIVQTRQNGLWQQISSFSDQDRNVSLIAGATQKFSIDEICSHAAGAKKIVNADDRLIFDWELTSHPSGMINLI
jgi:hypothetical protein